MAQKIANYRYEIIDIAERVKDAVDGDDMANPAEKLTQVESRLSLIERLEKKYGANIHEIKEKRNEIAAKIEKISKKATSGLKNSRTTRERHATKPFPLPKR